MSKSFAAGAAPTRRRIIKAAAALLGGSAAPTFLRIGSALAAYPERPVKIVVANTAGGPSDAGIKLSDDLLEHRDFLADPRPWLAVPAKVEDPMHVCLDKSTACKAEFRQHA
jgi:hypothetical protein